MWALTVAAAAERQVLAAAARTAAVARRRATVFALSVARNASSKCAVHPITALGGATAVWRCKRAFLKSIVGALDAVVCTGTVTFLAVRVALVAHHFGLAFAAFGGNG